MSKFYNRRIEAYKERRENVLKGNINCIPSPFTRFRAAFPGIEQAKYYLVTGNEKSAKSQITDYIFMLHPLMYAYKNPDKIKLKILYFSLEMSKNDKYDQLTCFWLYTHSRGRIKIDTKILNSVDENNPLPQEILDLLESEEYKKFFDFIDEHVIFDESTSHPTGIYKKCKEFAENNGQYTYKRRTFKNEYGVEVENVVADSFIKNDENEYWIVITDHLSLFTVEKGLDLRGTIGRFSSDYCVKLKNLNKFTIVNIQQQSATSQDNESFKLNRLTPHPGNLAEYKSSKNDVNMMLGIFSPYRFGKPTWGGYDIKSFKDNIRFLEIILNRNGLSGVVCPLYFDGAVNFFAELPQPNTPELIKFEEMARNAQIINNI